MSWPSAADFQGKSRFRVPVCSVEDDASRQRLCVFSRKQLSTDAGSCGSKRRQNGKPVDAEIAAEQPLKGAVSLSSESSSGESFEVEFVSALDMKRLRTLASYTPPRSAQPNAVDELTSPDMFSSVVFSPSSCEKASYLAASPVGVSQTVYRTPNKKRSSESGSSSDVEIVESSPLIRLPAFHGTNLKTRVVSFQSSRSCECKRPPERRLFGIDSHGSGFADGIVGAEKSSDTFDVEEVVSSPEAKPGCLRYVAPKLRRKSAPNSLRRKSYASLRSRFTNPFAAIRLPSFSATSPRNLSESNFSMNESRFEQLSNSTVVVTRYGPLAELTSTQDSTFSVEKENHLLVSGSGVKDSETSESCLSDTLPLSNVVVLEEHSEKSFEKTLTVAGTAAANSSAVLCTTQPLSHDFLNPVLKISSPMLENDVKECEYSKAYDPETAVKSNHLLSVVSNKSCTANFVNVEDEDPIEEAEEDCHAMTPSMFSGTTPLTDELPSDERELPADENQFHITLCSTETQFENKCVSPVAVVDTATTQEGVPMEATRLIYFKPCALTPWSPFDDPDDTRPTTRRWRSERRRKLSPLALALQKALRSSRSDVAMWKCENLPQKPAFNVTVKSKIHQWGVHWTIVQDVDSSKSLHMLDSVEFRGTLPAFRPKRDKQGDGEGTTAQPPAPVTPLYHPLFAVEHDGLVLIAPRYYRR